MKSGGPPFVGWKGLITAIAIIAGCMFAPAYCQTSDVSLLLQQTPAKAGATTPLAGVYHFELNSEVTLTAEPKPGYQFLYWLGEVSEPAATITTVYLDKPKIIIAVFEQTEYGAPDTEMGLPIGGGGGGGGSSLATNVMNYGQAGSISSGAGGIKLKPKLQKPIYPKSNEVIPEPATGLLLVIGSVFAFTRRSAKSKS